MTFEELPGWCDFDEFYQEVVDRLDGGTLVEIGCYLGRSLCSLGTKAKASGKPFHVIGVEIGTGSGIEGDGKNYHADAIDEGFGTLIGQLHRNLIAFDLTDIVTLIVAPSVRAATLFADNSLPFVFIDANHEQPAVEADIGSWLPKIKRGGVLAGHDYTRHWRGVTAAVNRLLPRATPYSKSSWKYVKE